MTNINYPGDIICILRPLGDERTRITLHDDLDPAELPDLLPSKVERRILAHRLRLWLTEIESIDDEPDKKTETITVQVPIEGTDWGQPPYTPNEKITPPYRATWEKA